MGDTVQKLISNKTSKLISDIDDVYSTIKKERECFHEAKQDKVQWEIKNIFSSYINDLYEIIKGEKETKQSSPPEIRNRLLKNVDDAYIILKTKKEGKVVEDEKDYHTKFFSFIDAVYNDIKVNKQHLDSGRNFENEQDIPESQKGDIQDSILQEEYNLLSKIDDIYYKMKKKNEKNNDKGEENLQSEINHYFSTYINNVYII